MYTAQEVTIRPVTKNGLRRLRELIYKEEQPECGAPPTIRTKE